MTKRQGLTLRGFYEDCRPNSNEAKISRAITAGGWELGKLAEIALELGLEHDADHGDVVCEIRRLRRCAESK